MSSVGRSVGTGLKKLYGSLRVNGRPSRSKSVSNLQELFNPPTQEELKQPVIDEQEKDSEIDEVEKENILRKSMELSALRRKSLDFSKLAERSSSGILDKSINSIPQESGSPGTPERNKRRRAAGVKFDPEKEKQVLMKSASRNNIDSPKVAQSPGCMKKKETVNMKPRTPKRRKSSEQRVYVSSGNNLVEKCDGFRFELGRKEAEATPMIESAEACYYRDVISRKPHNNFVGTDSEDAPVIISLLKKKLIEEAGPEEICAIKRTKDGDQFVAAKDLKPHLKAGRLARAVTSKDLAKRLHPTEIQGLRKVKNHALVNELCKFEERETIRNFKVGVISVRDEQTNELEFFANDGISEAMSDFMNCIGSRVPLEGFQGYLGGLDNEHGKTGSESYHAIWKEHEFMFHVAPLLPNVAHDQQKLERKRHIGNDVMVIVFLEGNKPFIPSSIATQFTQIYVVVRPDDTGDEVKYQVAFATREGVPVFGPELPSPALFNRGASFRDFLLTKLVNGERTVLAHLPVFEKRLSKARKEILEDYIKTIPNQK